MHKLPRPSNSRMLSLALLAGAAISQGVAQGPAVAVLHNFTGVPGDGASPVAGVVLGSNGVLYGTAFAGGSGIACGAAGCGTVYSLTPPATAGGAWTPAVLHDFTGGGTDGAEPAAVLAIDTNGVLYGTTYAGGTASGGTVFSLTPPSTAGGPWTEAILYNFIPNSSTGAFPAAGVVIDQHGALYGTTVYGGASRLGTVFWLTPPKKPGGAWNQAVLYSFPGGGRGATPLAGLVLNGNKTLFGTTSAGGTGYGIAFGLHQASSGGPWKQTVLHSFGGPTADGASPQASLVVGAGGILYGTTVSGGTAGYGTVFSLTPPTTGGGAWTETLLYNFTGGSDGGEPRAGLWITSTGALLGTAYNGGSAGYGAVFVINPPATPGGPWTESVAYSFPGGGGANPQAGVVADATGLLYGSTYAGGGSNLGTVFALLP